MSSVHRSVPRRAALKRNKALYANPAGLSTQLHQQPLGGAGSMVMPTARSMEKLAATLVRWPTQPHVWLLRGELGAGKTTLVQAVARRLGVRRAISSPTFGLSKSYRLRGQPWTRLVHIDAYRVRGRHEHAALQLAELVTDRSALVVVEWPNRLSRVAWGRHLLITLEHLPRGRRARIRLRRR